MKKISLLLLLSSILIIITLLLAINTSTIKTSKSPVYLENKNSIVTNIWLHEESKLNILKENKIKYLFVDIGDTSNLGFIKTPESNIKSFLNFINKFEKKNNYDFAL